MSYLISRNCLSTVPRESARVLARRRGCNGGKGNGRAHTSAPGLYTCCDTPVAALIRCPMRWRNRCLP